MSPFVRFSPVFADLGSLTPPPPCPLFAKMTAGKDRQIEPHVRLKALPLNFPKRFVVLGAFKGLSEFLCFCACQKPASLWTEGYIFKVLTMPRRIIKDPHTLDLFQAVTAPSIVARFPPERVKAKTLEGKLCRAVCEALTTTDMSRDEVALKMASHLGEDVSKSQLNSWASMAKESTHRMPATRLITLCFALGQALKSIKMLSGQNCE